MVANIKGITRIKEDGPPRHLPEREVLLEAIRDNYEAGHFSAATAALSQLVRHCGKLDLKLRNEVLEKLGAMKDRALRRQSEESSIPYAHKKGLDELVEKLETSIKAIQDLSTTSLPIEEKRTGIWYRVTHFLLDL